MNSSLTQALAIYFVDGSLADLAILISSIPEGAEVHVIDPASDGLQQMLDALSGRTGLGSIQILSHGSTGQLQLGSSLIDSNYLSTYASSFATLGSSLGADGDVLLYGCNVAEGDVGQAFINQLSSLIGADVAASEDITGANALGGDWTLEASTGSIEAASLEVANYEGALFSYGGYTFQTAVSGTISTSDPVNPNPFISGQTTYWDRWVPSGAVNGQTLAVYIDGGTLSDPVVQIERNGSVLTQDDDGGDGLDSFLSYTYQSGDVIRATVYSQGQLGTYTLYMSVSGGATDIGSAPPPPANVAPTFGGTTFTSGNTVQDTVNADSFSALTGNLHASDTDGGTMSYSGGGSGTYGSLSVASNGSFTFTPNTSAVEGLRSSTTQSFNVSVSDGQGGSASSTVTFNINGVNDAIVASNNTASATEASGINNATAGTNPTGNVLTNDADRDSGDTKTVSSSTGNIAGTYGTLNLSSSGAYTYTVNNGNAAVDALNSGQTLTDTFSYTVQDGGGNTSTASLTVSINGQNDRPTAVADTGTAVELGSAVAGSNATGNVLDNDTDADAGETAGLTVNAFTLTGTYGTLTLNANGTYSYAVDNTLTAVQALRTTANTLQDVFTYTVKDVNNTSNTANLTITIQGSNDNPVGRDDDATAIEKSGTANATTGSNGTGNVLTNDTDVDSTANGETKTVTAVRAGASGGTDVAAGSVVTGGHGTLTLNANGTYSYAIAEGDATVQALQTGQSTTDLFNYTVTDAAGGTSTAVLTITIQGRNDAPTFTSDASPIALTDTAIYNGPYTNTTGTVAGTDVDSAGVSYDVRGGVTSVGTSILKGLYGTLSVNTSNGSWTFNPDEVTINALSGVTPGLDVGDVLADGVDGGLGGQRAGQCVVRDAHGAGLSW